MFGHREEEDEEDGAASDTEVASSLYHEPYTLMGDASAPAGRKSKLVKNYSCGRLCDYEDSLLRRHHAPNKFGSTPLFLSSAAGGTATPAASGGTAAVLGSGTGRGSKPPPTSHSFTSSVYEKDYRKPNFPRGDYANSGGGGSGYAVPLSRSKQSLGRALSVPQPPTAAPLTGSGGGENFYAATDIIQVGQ